MTIEQAFDKAATLGLTHEQEVAIMKLIGKYGRDEYKRGYEASSAIHKEYSL